MGRYILDIFSKHTQKEPFIFDGFNGLGVNVEIQGIVWLSSP